MLPLWLLELLDLFFITFHSILVIFNIFGWMFRKVRIYNLYALLLTGASWFLLGIWYGWGYCFCTDWHWQVRRALGDTDLPVSYITFLIQHWTSFQPDPYLVDIATGIIFGLALILSAMVNYQDYSIKPEAGRQKPEGYSDR